MPELTENSLSLAIAKFERKYGPDWTWLVIPPELAKTAEILCSLRNIPCVPAEGDVTYGTSWRIQGSLAPNEWFVGGPGQRRGEVTLELTKGNLVLAAVEYERARGEKPNFLFVSLELYETGMRLYDKTQPTEEEDQHLPKLYVYTQVDFSPGEWSVTYISY